MSTAARPRAALFDIDGTLVDSNYLHVDAWQRALADQGASVDGWRIHRAIGQDSVRLVRSLAGERDEVWIERVKDLHAAHYRELAPRLRPFASTVELLRAVAGRGIRVVLATSAPGDELKLLLDTIDAGDDVFATTSADDVERAKPDPEVIDVALGRGGVQPSEAVLVGDSTWDMIAARRAGLTAFGLRCGGFPDADLGTRGPEASSTTPPISSTISMRCSARAARLSLVGTQPTRRPVRPSREDLPVHVTVVTPSRAPGRVAWTVRRRADEEKRNDEQLDRR